MIPQTAPTPPSYLSSLSSHLHFEGETCPTCEQEIPPERLKEISGKIAAKQHEQAHAITVKLETKAKADLELERQNSAAREAAACEEVRKAAEATAADKLAEAERTRQEMQAGLQQQVAQAEASRLAAEQAGANLQTQFQRLLKDSQAALTAAKAEAQAKEVEIRAEALQAAQAAVAEQLTTSENARLVSEAALQARIMEIEATKTAAEKQSIALQAQLDELRTTKDAEVAKMKDEAAAAAVRIQQEATEAATVLVRDQIAAKDQAVADAEAKSVEAEGKLAKLSEQHEVVLNERLGSQREILEKAKDEALNAERAKAFEDSQKLQNKVTELQRALDNKTAEELGEGAEVNLFEALKKEFPTDRIERVNKGAPGADIHHVVVHRGRECGTIIYDSKNHKTFRADHVAKLVEDQIAARAEHAILSLHKFPKGTGQLHMDDGGVLLANPARVVAAVTLIRRHMVKIHSLRLSNAEREEKTAALYAFITSERCAQLLGRIEKQADDLLELQTREIRWHKNNWEKQGEAYKAIQKTKGDLESDISGIVGTAAAVPGFEDAELLHDVDEGSPLIAGSRRRSDVGQRSGRIPLIDQL
jgi:hypothetical protein